jgi:hypothetical protein
MSGELVGVIGLSWRDIADQIMWIAMGAAATALPSSMPHDTALAWIAILREEGVFVMPVTEGEPRINDAPLMRAYEELRTLADAEHVPPRIKCALVRLSDCHNKLFVTVFVQESALGAADGCIRFEPSDLLGELILALTALDWPQVMVLVHGACSAPETAL